MKATGIIRKIDDLGRVVIPKEIRRTQHWEVGTPLEIFVEECGAITLKEYKPGCTFCGNVAENMARLGGKLVCSRCAGLLIGRKYDK